MSYPNVNEIHDNDTQTIKKFADKYLKQAEEQRLRAYNYYLKIKDDPDYKEKVKLRKHEYYINNKENLREKEKFRYHNNIEYHDKKRARARELYKQKTADIVKMKRGRRPKPKPENDDEIKVVRPRGRPKKNTDIV